MTMVLASTDEVPELADVIARRHAAGLDWYDEWWEGVYRIVAGPSPEHGRLIVTIGGTLLRHAEPRGLYVAAPVNVGVDKWDAKVPDIGVYRPDTPRHSPAFLRTADLVVEILSPGERSGEKLPFYLAKGVREYLEVDQHQRTVTLLRNTGSTWEPAPHSDVLGIDLADLTIDWPTAPPS